VSACINIFYLIGQFLHIKATASAIGLKKKTESYWDRWQMHLSSTKIASSINCCKPRSPCNQPTLDAKTSSDQCVCSSGLASAGNALRHCQGMIHISRPDEIMVHVQEECSVKQHQPALAARDTGTNSHHFWEQEKKSLLHIQEYPFTYSNCSKHSTAKFLTATSA